MESSSQKAIAQILQATSDGPEQTKNKKNPAEIRDEAALLALTEHRRVNRPSGTTTGTQRSNHGTRLPPRH